MGLSCLPIVLVRESVCVSLCVCVCVRVHVCIMYVCVHVNQIHHNILILADKHINYIEIY
jgi:hypothetical protein